MSPYWIPQWLQRNSQLAVPPSLVLKFHLYRSVRLDAVYKQLRSDKLDCGWDSNANEALKSVVWQSFDVLWELYCKHHYRLDKMISALAVSVPEHEQYDREFQDAAFLKFKPVIDLFYPLSPSSLDRLGRSKATLARLRRDMQALPGFDPEALYSAAEVFQEIYSRSGILSDESLASIQRGAFQSQSRSDFEQRLRAHLTDHLQGVHVHISTWLDDLQKSSHNPQLVVPDAVQTVDIMQGRETAKALVLFAPSGVGKTHTIHHFLSHHFGFYFQACLLPASSKDVGIHDARRASGPNDTMFLRDLIEYAKHLLNETSDGGTLTSFAEKRFTILLKCRYTLFVRFLSLASKCNSTVRNNLPRLWLALQTNADAAVLFDRLFQIASLCDFNEDEEEDLQFLGVHLYKNLITHYSDRRLYFCLDEAQTDLNMLILSRETDEHPRTKRSLLNFWAIAFASFSRRLFESSFINRLDSKEPVIPNGLSVFTGTSLRLREAIPEVENVGLEHRVEFRNGQQWPWNLIYKVSLVYHFPLVTISELEALMDRHMITTRIADRLDKADIRKTILQCGTPLLGRPRWSILYLDELYRTASSSGQQPLHLAIQQAADNIVKQVKGDLIQRLQNLYQLTKERNAVNIINLIRNLCRVVIHNDLLDTGYAFLDDANGILISEGFAVMIPIANSPKQVLAETLAVQAAKQFFLATDKAMLNLVDEQLSEMIQAQQNDPRALGKTAEWFLAWSLCRIFNSDFTRLLGSRDGERSRRILELLSRGAEPLNGQTHGLNVAGYTVVPGEKIGYMYQDTRSTTGLDPMELSTWMDRVRSGQTPNATYYFPDDRVGPDIVFALQSPGDGVKKTVLCLLQLKCGAFELAKGIATTDLSRAYEDHNVRGKVLKGCSQRKTALDNELRKWNSPNLSILRVLFTAATKNNGQGANNNIPAGLPGCQEYYVRVDETGTGLFFGGEFDFFLNAKRGNRGTQRTVEMYHNLWQQLGGST